MVRRGRARGTSVLLSATVHTKLHTVTHTCMLARRKHAHCAHTHINTHTLTHIHTLTPVTHTGISRGMHGGWGVSLESGEGMFKMGVHYLSHSGMLPAKWLGLSIVRCLTLSCFLSRSNPLTARCT